ncbi:hypothetical protein NFI96_003378 [Prochilodus magdalenae]|nr:hypothetical protein NFI96_003378 [Prochilodus magdalenae]
MGVVCGLYGGAVTNLGSAEQVEKLYVPVTQKLTCTGMFALTEKGHGSNARGILTEAHYEPSTQEFVIHTPCEDAQKMYIGNAMKGNYAAVFAQLIISGESQGPHCFVVPVRDQRDVMWPGVTTIDMKYKEGLHGVDNGILIFDNVRIPRENLLDKFGSVSVDGRYSSPIRRKGERFNAMLAALTPTRLALTVQAMAAMKDKRLKEDDLTSVYGGSTFRLLQVAQHEEDGAINPCGVSDSSLQCATVTVELDRPGLDVIPSFDFQIASETEH